MAERSFARKVMEYSEVPQGSEKERQHTGRSYSLRVKLKSGRVAEGFPWALFNGYQWSDDGDVETLTILFSNRVLTITGEHLGCVIDALDNEQLKAIQEHDRAQAEVIRAANANGPEAKPIIISVSAEPPFEEVAKQITTTREEPYENGPPDYIRHPEH